MLLTWDQNWSKLFWSGKNIKKSSIKDKVLEYIESREYSLRKNLVYMEVKIIVKAKGHARCERVKGIRNAEVKLRHEWYDWCMI